jgi:hypothetical protein
VPQYSSPGRARALTPQPPLLNGRGKPSKALKRPRPILLCRATSNEECGGPKLLDGSSWRQRERARHSPSSLLTTLASSCRVLPGRDNGGRVAVVTSPDPRAQRGTHDWQIRCPYLVFIRCILGARLKPSPTQSDNFHPLRHHE